jgi:hypothetical protein
VQQERQKGDSATKKRQKEKKEIKERQKKERNEKSARRGKKKEIGGVEVSEDKQGARSAKNYISKGQKSTPLFVLFSAADPSCWARLIRTFIAASRNE